MKFVVPKFYFCRIELCPALSFNLTPFINEGVMWCYQANPELNCGQENIHLNMETLEFTNFKVELGHVKA